MRQRPIYEIMIDTDWITTVGTAAILTVAGALAISEARQLISGKAVERVSLSTIIFALYCSAFAFSFRAKLLKLAFALMAVEAASRVILNYVHAPSGLRHIAAVGGLVLNLAGLMIMVFAIVTWFRSVLRRIPPLKPEDPIP